MEGLLPGLPRYRFSVEASGNLLNAKNTYLSTLEV